LSSAWTSCILPLILSLAMSPPVVGAIRV